LDRRRIDCCLWEAIVGPLIGKRLLSPSAPDDLHRLFKAGALVVDGPFEPLILIALAATPDAKLQMATAQDSHHRRLLGQLQ
jgi:hypothetical protein